MYLTQFKRELHLSCLLSVGPQDCSSMTRIQAARIGVRCLPLCYRRTRCGKFLLRGSTGRAGNFVGVAVWKCPKNLAGGSAVLQRAEVVESCDTQSNKHLYLLIYIRHAKACSALSEPLISDRGGASLAIPCRMLHVLRFPAAYSLGRLPAKLHCPPWQHRVQ